MKRSSEYTAEQLIVRAKEDLATGDYTSATAAALIAIADLLAYRPALPNPTEVPF